MQMALYDARDAEEARDVGRASEVGPASEAGRAGSQPQPAYSPHSPDSPSSSHLPRLCAACRAREARYGFRPAHEEDPTLERPRTLCFECFRMEMDRRRVVAAQLARGWNATQAKLPLPDRLETLARRRGRAQIAARHALNLR
jgi:hypothetical protein